MKRKFALAALGTMVLGMGVTLTGCSVIDQARDLIGFGGTSSSENTVAVQAVSMIADIGSFGMQDRYSGVVVAQATQEINKQEDRTVKELKVAVGDTVKKGQVLFTYDIEEMQLAIDMGKLELEKIQNTISSTNKQIEQLESEKRKASQSDQLSYSIEIQSLQADVKEAEYQLQTKTVEQELLEKTLGNADVTSGIDGVVQSINESGDSEDGGSDAYIVLMETGNYRVKGIINEMNRAALTGMEDKSLIIRSRVNNDEIWMGTLEKVDTQNPVQSNDDYGYGDSDDTSQSTNYPFYVSLENSDGLMMGQHVYIELDQGQTTAKRGIWLPSSFLDLQGDETFIWAANARDRLEKRSVELGEYDAELDQYEVLSGISASDYIAIADVSLKEGMPVTRYDESTWEDEDWDFEEGGSWAEEENFGAEEDAWENETWAEDGTWAEDETWAEDWGDESEEWEEDLAGADAEDAGEEMDEAENNEVDAPDDDEAAPDTGNLDVNRGLEEELARRSGQDQGDFHREAGYELDHPDYAGVDEEGALIQQRGMEALE